MDIHIEIGTDEQKKIITDEIQVIEEIINGIDDPPHVIGLWVPEDFDLTVNKLQNTSDYTSNRGQCAIAKNVLTDEGTYLVFSPVLYTNQFDNQMRIQIYLHEMIHTFHAQIFPQTLKSSPSFNLYGTSIYILYDEYCTNRKSFALTKQIFPEPSERYKKFMRSTAKGLLLDTINAKYYDNTKNEIFFFRDHGNIGVFIDNTRNNFDEVAKAFVYLYAHIDEYGQFSRYEKFLPKSRFHCDAAMSLINFFRDKYESQDVDLYDGIEYLIGYMEKFGVRFSDNNGGLYCHVIDI